ncbi:acyltransferase family protein [Citrobacter farmeri]
MFAPSLAYVFIKKKEAIPFGALTKNIVSVVGVSLIIYSIIFIREKDFPGYNAIYPVLGAALLIASGPTSFVNRYVISNKAFVFIGLISYPLYLWHWPIFTYLRIITSGNVADRYMWVAVSAAFVISIVTYYLWEKPLRFSTNKPRTACLLALLVFLIGATGLAIYLSDGVKSRSVVSDASAVNAQFTGSLWKYTSNDICLNRYPMNGRNEYKWFFCMQNNDSQPDIMLYGSSFANQQYPGMIDNPAFDGKTILSIGTCAPDMPDSSARHDNHPCAADRPGQVKDLVKDIIIKSPGLKYVIIDGVDYEHKEGNLERLSDFIKWVEGQGRTVVVFYPHVRPFFDTKACFSRPFSPKAKECVAANTERNRMEKNFIEMRNSISKTLPGTLFFNQNDALCDGDYCPFVRDGLPMYRDKVHLSVYGSDLVIRNFVDWAKENKLSILK